MTGAIYLRGLSSFVGLSRPDPATLGEASMLTMGSAMQLLDTHKLAMLSSFDTGEVSTLLSRYLSPVSVRHLDERKRPARVGGFQVGAISFALIDFGAPVQIKADSQSDYHIIMVCLRGSADLTVDERTVHLKTDCGFLARPAHGISGQFSADCVRLMIRIDAKVMAAEGFPDLNEAVNPNNPQLTPLFEQVQFILSSPSLMEVISKDRTTSVQMENLLISLLKSVDTLYPKHSEQSSSIVSRDVRRAEVFMHKHSGDNVMLKDIVHAAGVSTRALQNNFMRFRKTSPMHHLRNVRLMAARDRLLKSDVRTLISNVALESGFTHLGRFALFYREKYRESPSETVRRSRCGRLA